jgi:hypothetical protein
MNSQAINQKKAVELLKKGESIADFEVKFNDEKVEALDALMLRKHGVPLPNVLVYYNDEDIDFSDDPDITDEDFPKEQWVSVLRAEVIVDKEIADWVRKNHIDMNGLLSTLVRDFYHNKKTVSGVIPKNP